MSLRSIRQAVGISQSDLGDLMNVSRQTIAAWEQGVTEPVPTVIRKLAWVLRVSEAEIYQAVIRARRTA